MEHSCPTCGHKRATPPLITYDTGARMIFGPDFTIAFGKKQGEVVYLLLSARTYVSREQLFDHLYEDEGHWPDPNAIDVLIRDIRKKLAHSRGRVSIVNSHGAGWRMVVSAP